MSCLRLPTPISLSVSQLILYPTRHTSLSYRCTNRTHRQQWDILSQSKSRILDFVASPTVNNGVKLSAVKFMQRVILLQTRGVSDPRVVIHLRSMAKLITV